MGFLDDLVKSTNKMINEIDSDAEYTRGQSFLEKFWDKKNELLDAKDSSYGKEKSTISRLLDLLNRKGKENDMESW